MAVKQPYNNKMELIATQKIDPSPFQKRKYFDEEKLKELAASIEREGLIEPIITRPKGKRYPLISAFIILPVELLKSPLLIRFPMYLSWCLMLSSAK